MFQLNNGYYMDSDVEVDPSYYNAIIDAAKGKKFNSYEETRFIFYLGDDSLQRPILVLVSCFLPTSVDELDKAMRYTVHYTQEHVKSDFVIIQCLTRTNVLNDASGNFLQNYYSLLPVKYKKNLKKVIMFHYGVSNRALLSIISSYMSPRFMRKLDYSDSIKELLRFIPDMPEDELLKKIPYIIKHDDAELQSQEFPKLIPMSLTDMCIYDGFYLPNYGVIPAIIIDIIQKLSKPDIVSIPGLFNLQANASNLYSMVNEINSGVPFRSSDSDPKALVSVFKLLLDSTNTPIFDEKLFHDIVTQCKISGTNELAHSFYINVLREAISRLPDSSKYTVKYIVDFFSFVSTNSKANNMTTQKIAEIFSPTFCRPSSIGKNIMYEVIPPCVDCINVLITDRNNVFADLLPKIKDNSYSQKEINVVNTDQESVGSVDNTKYEENDENEENEDGDNEDKRNNSVVEDHESASEE
ncbi:hypothetical protein FG386_003355 [Cryptosporidium ryanae]|uniref:uncharacterized protein n=1 Tax=Cryptosporidium ryanae TaxID=515981 RepID=UPI00351AA401|nr:hypothetical protein FG386_003355 [Cryptosporidium ryanae]